MICTVLVPESDEMTMQIKDGKRVENAFTIIKGNTVWTLNVVKVFRRTISKVLKFRQSRTNEFDILIGRTMIFTK